VPADRPLEARLPWGIPVALVASAFIVLGSAYITYGIVGKVADASQGLAHAGETLDAATRLRSVLHAAETGQRGYLLTGDATYLAPYQRARQLVPELLQELNALSGDDEAQRKRVLSLDKLVADRMGELRTVIAAFESGDRDAAMRIMRTNRGFESMESILGILGELREDLVRKRSLRSDLMEQQIRLSRLSEVFTAVVMLAQLLLCYSLVARYLHKRRESEAALALLNHQLEDTVRKRTEELADLSQHLLTLREEERARVARELHDDLGSNLTVASMDLHWVLQRMEPESPLALRLARTAQTLSTAVEGKRRIIEDLRPTMLEHLGLREAIRSYAEEYSDRAGIAVEVDMPEKSLPLRKGTPIALFRIVQETLTNASRHAKADSVTVSMRKVGEKAVLKVSDDGVGIDRSINRKRGSHGILGIRERTKLMGGTSDIQRGADGRGTVVTVTVPLSGDKEDSEPG